MDPRAIFMLDTGPLLDFVILSYQHETRTKWWARHEQLHALRTEKDRRLFHEMLKSCRGRIKTSSGVVAEIQAKIRAAARKHRSSPKGGQPFGNQAWSILRREFQEWGVSEDMVTLLDMQLPLVAELEPVDVSLIELAKRAMKEGGRGMVLTNDRNLLARCHREEVSAEFVADALESFRATV